MDNQGAPIREGNARKGHVPCPDCGNSIEFLDGEHSLYFSCGNCGLHFRAEVGMPAEPIKKFYPSDAVVPHLPLGSTGTLKGQSFTVTGFLYKKDPESYAAWHEYLLTTPGKPNYHVLVEYGGNWMLVARTNLRQGDYTIEKTGSRFYPEYELCIVRTGNRYRHYTTYHFNILYAIGEFDWDTLEEDGALQAVEYVYPPTMFIKETMNGQSEWYRGTVVGMKELAQAFKLQVSELPTAWNPGILEKPKYDDTQGPMARFTLLACGIAFIILLLTTVAQPTGQAFSTSLTTIKDSTAAWSTYKTLSTPSFELRSSRGINVRLSADVKDEWLELATTLVNDKTGKQYDFTRTLEHYSGVEDGEAWSEGSNVAEAVLSRVPAGTYHFVISPGTDANREMTINIKVEQNTVFFSNFGWTLFLILVVPVTRYMIRRIFESKKWTR